MRCRTMQFSTATEEIIIYKVLEKIPVGYITPITKDLVPKNGILKAEGELERKFLMWLFYVRGGVIHGFKDFEHAREYADRSVFKLYIFKAVIPIGTKYLPGFDGRIVAMTIHIDLSKAL